MKSDGHKHFSEWEDSVLFDADDPDFCGTIDGSRPNPALINTHHTDGMRKTSSLQVLNTLLFKVPSTMSVASVHASNLADLRSSLGRSSLSVSSSLSDLVGSPFEHTDNVLTIEDLRSQMGSCFTCGVSWTEEHVSLDCSECGGYSLERPCPLCDGKCGVVWKRDFTMSHAAGKAKWHGVCPNYALTHNHHGSATILSQQPPQTCGSSQHLAQELCSRLEKLSAKAQT